jgi:hypothetical protein
MISQFAISRGTYYTEIEDVWDVKEVLVACKDSDLFTYLCRSDGQRPGFIEQRRNQSRNTGEYQLTMVAANRIGGLAMDDESKSRTSHSRTSDKLTI